MVALELIVFAILLFIIIKKGKLDLNINIDVNIKQPETTAMIPVKQPEDENTPSIDDVLKEVDRMWDGDNDDE